MAMTSPNVTRWLSRLALLAIVAGVILLIVTGRELLQARDYNQAQAAQDWKRAARHPSGHGLLAAAYSQAGQLAPDASDADFQETVRAFARLTSSATEPVLRRQARYSLATLYLQRGLQLLAAEQHDLANPLIELAKGMYRERLSVEPDHWNSKYNLEQALHALPDATEEEAPPEQRNPGPSSRAVGAGRSKRQLP